jgi:hypothetical protein
MDYCQNLQLAGHSNWRLASIDELMGIYDSIISGIYHVKGNLQLSAREWSGSQGHASGEEWSFNFILGERYSDPLGYGIYNRALCVRGPGE